MAAPLAQFSGSGWLSAAAASLAVLPLCGLPKRWDGMAKPLAVLQILFLGLVTGGLLGYSAVNWPSSNDQAVPLTLLALAAVTKGRPAAGIGSVLAMCMALLAIPAAVSGAARVELRWLGPEWAAWPWGLTLVLLLPNLPTGKESRGVGSIGTLAVLLSLLVQGTISWQTAHTLPDPFYQTARALGHMEPLIAVALTLGWYALAVYLLQSAEVLMDRGSMIAAVIAATALCLGVETEGIVWTGIAAVVWLVIPFLQSKKKNEKR